VWGWVALSADRRTRIRGLIAASMLLALCLMIVWYAQQRVMIFCLTGDC
jgi:hypothetical protein